MCHCENFNLYAQQLNPTPVKTPVKMTFILVSVVILVLVILRNLIFTTRMILGEWRCRKPSVDFFPGLHKEMKHYHFDRFSDIMFTFTGFLHIPEHIYLLVYLYKFIGVYFNWEKGYKKEIWSEMKTFMWRSKPSEEKRQHNKINIMRAVRALLNGTVLVLMLSVALLLPSVSIARIHIQGNTTEEYCSERLAFIQRSLTYSFHGVSFFTNTVVALTRLLMVFFTIMIGVMWRRVKPSTKDRNRQENRYSKVLTNKINKIHTADYQAALVSSNSSPS